MSNIPSSAMPHAGGQSNTTDASSGSSTSGQFSSGQSGSTSGDATSGQFSAGQGASTSGGSSGQFSGQSTSTTTGTSQYQPSQSYNSSASSYESGETMQRTRRRDTVMEKARDNKTGLAIGIVGAAAAAAIPFLLSKRSKSKEQHREFPVSVDNRTQASGSFSERDSFSSDDSFSAKNRGNKNNY